MSRRNEYQPKGLFSWRVKAGMVRVWVAGNCVIRLRHISALWRYAIIKHLLHFTFLLPVIFAHLRYKLDRINISGLEFSV